MNAPIGDVGLNETEHLLGGAGSLDKHTIVDLEQSEELQNFAGLGSNFVDTRNWSTLVLNVLNPTHPLIRTTKYTLG